MELILDLQHLYDVKENLDMQQNRDQKHRKQRIFKGDSNFGHYLAHGITNTSLDKLLVKLN